MIISHKKDSIKANRAIRAKEVRVIGPDGNHIGVLNIKEALSLAEEYGMDLVEISPNANPPVCKIMELGKYKYQLSKKEKEAKKKQHVIHVKELKMRPNIVDHDYEIKIKHAREFLEKHNKVKFTVRFRGREMMHRDKGKVLIERIIEDLSDIGEVEGKPSIEEERDMHVIIMPKKKKK